MDDIYIIYSLGGLSDLACHAMTNNDTHEPVVGTHGGHVVGYTEPL